MSKTSFKERACNIFIECATDYKTVFLDYDYLIYGDSLSIFPHYIISAKTGNYMHLTVVNSPLSPYGFFEKCLNGTLNEEDFNFIKPNMTENFVKGVVRNKIVALPSMADLFSQKLYAVESFKTGAITCSLATADKKITVGFEDRINARPKTLLKGNELRKANKEIIDISLILRRNRGVSEFDTIVQGNTKELLKLISKCISV